MTSIFTVNVAKGNTIGCLTRLCKISKNYNVTQVAFIKRLALREEVAKPKPWPYWDKQCSGMSMTFDMTSLRYDEGTKLFIVDGPPAAGKTKVCEKLAEEFGMLYMPPPTPDDMYINPYGFDLRTLDPQLPPACQSCDLNRFLSDPNNQQVGLFQQAYLWMRVEQYVNALMHILATGQGVVLNRSVYSDLAFSETMLNAGYLSKSTINYFDKMKRQCMMHLLKPHLVIYLDVPPEITLQNIKKRGNKNEINSKVFTTEYLSDLDRIMKETVLTSLVPHSEILIYDWSKECNILDVVHDIENLNLEEDLNKDKFQDWVFLDTEKLLIYLEQYQIKRTIFADMLANHMDVEAPDLMMSPEDSERMDEVLENVESEKYTYGYNPDLGDKTTFVKYVKYPFTLIRRRCRDFVNCKFFDSTKYVL